MIANVQPEIISYYDNAIHPGICMYIMPTGISFSKYIEEEQFARATPLSSGYFSDTFLIEAGGKPTFVFKLYYNKHVRRSYYKSLAIREMQALITVKHNPYATKLIAAQIEPDRACFLLSYIPGVTLLEWLKMHPLLLDRKAKIAQIKAGIVSIHADNIIHGDIKEDNIWVPNPDQVSDTIKEIIFLDFGLALPPNKEVKTEEGPFIRRTSFKGTTYTSNFNNQSISKLEERILHAPSNMAENQYSKSNIQKSYTGSLSMTENPRSELPYSTALPMTENPRSELPYSTSMYMAKGGSRELNKTRHIKEQMHIKLLLIRHSKSCANLIRENSARVRHTQKRKAIFAASQKVRDPGLTAVGRRMAESYGPALRAKAQAAGFDLDTATIGSSALRRAKETAALLFPAASLTVFPHIIEHGRIPENTPKRHAHTRPDWNAFLRHLRVDRATSEQAAAQFIVVGHGSYLREVWRELTGRPWSAFHNLDAFVLEGDLDVRGRLRVDSTERVPYTGLVSAKGAGDKCMLVRQTHKIKRGDR